MVEKILRMKIYDSTYWKEHCFALTAEAVVDKAVDIKSLGGTYGGARKPSKFVCLLLKLLQLQPDKDIIIEFIKNEDYKYVRILGMQQFSFCTGSEFTHCTANLSMALPNMPRSMPLPAYFVIGALLQVHFTCGLLADPLRYIIIWNLYTMTTESCACKIKTVGMH